MKYRIVADSGCDINQASGEKLDVTIVPLTIYIGDKEFKDDQSLDIPEMLKIMNETQTAPKTACPSPGDFMEAYEGDEESLFVVTLSSGISGTYSSGIMAREMFLEKKKKFIHVFDSLTASVGETLVSMKIHKLVSEGLGELEIVKAVNKYIKEMKTLFLIDSLDNLIKAGRINKLVGKVASALHVKPIMGGQDGTIKLFEKTRGYKRAFNRLIDMIGEIGENLEEKTLGIAHCNCLKRAEEFRDAVLKKYNFKNIIIVSMNGLSSVYANEGGLVIAF
ncbi:MAG: DegV family protein [Clostridiales bacterium]|nr:DegV family protein [Clostridiales bacterium]